jgi:hypothetical protein
VKRFDLILTAGLGFFVLSGAVAGTAWGAAVPSSTAVIIFNDSAHQAELIIPTPACPSTQPTCEWKFFLNEPKLSVDIATVYGTSGTVVIPYPTDFCGVIQADAYVGPPFVPKRGFQHTINDCDEPPTGTSSTDTTLGTTPMPAPPVVASNSGQLPTTPTAPPTVSASADLALTAASGTSPATDAAPTQLPFTGVDTKALWTIGLALLALGLALNFSASTWRKMLRYLLAVTPVSTTIPKHRIQRDRSRRR